MVDMLSSTEYILDSQLGQHVFTDTDLAVALPGTPASRYALVNKALARQEWIRLKRGCYVLNQKYAPFALSLMYFSSKMVPHSYISLETALSLHGLIPERVSSIFSIVSHGKNRTFKNHFGEFTYYVLPTNPYEFLTGVTRAEVGGQPFFLATPLRALADLMYIKKLTYTGLEWLTDSLRIEIEALMILSTNDFKMLHLVYRSKRVLHFLAQFEKDLAQCM